MSRIASTGSPGTLAAAVALAWGAAPAAAVDWDASQLARYGGTYSVHCSDPRQPRLNVTRDALTIDVPKQRMSGTGILAAVAAYGNAEPPPGYQIQLLSQVRGRESLIFEMYLDERGRYVKLMGSPLVEAALGKPALEAKHRDCDPVRSQRDGAAWLAGQGAVAGKGAAPLPPAAPQAAARPAPKAAGVVGRLITDEAGTVAAFQRAVQCEQMVDHPAFREGVVGVTPFKLTAITCAFVGGNATWQAQMLGLHDGQRYTKALAFAMLNVDSPVTVVGRRLVYEAKVTKPDDARCCPTGRARVEIDIDSGVATARPLGFRTDYKPERGRPLP